MVLPRHRLPIVDQPTNEHSVARYQLAVLEALRRLREPANWWTDAACRGQGCGPWFPEERRAQPPVEAKRLCANCPVVAECAEAGTRAFAVHVGWPAGAQEHQRAAQDRQPWSTAAGSGDCAGRLAICRCSQAPSGRAPEHQNGLPAWCDYDACRNRVPTHGLVGYRFCADRTSGRTRRGAFPDRGSWRERNVGVRRRPARRAASVSTLRAGDEIAERCLGSAVLDGLRRACAHPSVGDARGVLLPCGPDR